MTVTILLIEDNRENRYLATYLLEARGHVVRAAADGAEGIAMARALRPALILLDIQLPGLDGYTVARQLRSDHDLDSTPIVAVTSYAMAGDREKALAAGCDAYLEKPIDPATFVADVERLLKPTQGGIGG